MRTAIVFVLRNHLVVPALNFVWCEEDTCYFPCARHDWDGGVGAHVDLFDHFFVSCVACKCRRTMLRAYLSMCAVCFYFDAVGGLRIVRACVCVCVSLLTATYEY